MCHDGNSATQSVRYLNSQISALYLNASECVGTCGPNLDFKSLEYDKTKYSRSLAQYHFVGPKPKNFYSTNELFFSANFAQPKLTFICNHEAVLHLTIKDGHFNLDHSKANVPGVRVESTKNKSLKNVTVAFRMNFSRSGIKGGSQKIGNGSGHLIQLMILDFESANLASFNPPQAYSDTEALSYYMRIYLEFLEHAGHHTLFDIPDFDDDKYSPTIDYSLGCTPQDVHRLCSTEVVHGIDLSQINNFMHKKWLSIARLGHPKDQLSACMAEISSTWLLNAAIDSKFHIQFGPPKVKALCKHEVILTFDVEKIAFFHTDDFESDEPEEYSHWQVAFVVDVIEEKEADGCITKLKLDLNTARFSHHFSCVSETTEFAIAHFYQIVQFLSVDYLDILTQYSMHIVYHHDTRIITTPHGHGGHHVFEDSGCEDTGSEDAGEWSGVVEKEKKWHRRHGHVALWTERIEHTVMFGYDQILAVSEESINQMFYGLWSKSTRKDFDVVLSKWSLDMFAASFESLKVRLLTNGKAVVWVNVQGGHLRVKSETEKKKWTPCELSHATTSDKAETHNFSDLSLAFEVDLKMVEHQPTHYSDSWFHRFSLSHIFQCHNDVPSRVFKHLVLDLCNATYRPDLSNVDCLCEGKGRMIVNKLETAIHYIKEYLGDLAHHGHNIIHCDGSLQYVWEHRDGWSHEHEGTSGDEKNGQYSIDCRTRNKLSVPTIYRPGVLEIILYGESSLKVSVKDVNQHWSKKTSASWSANLSILSRPNGLQIEVTGSTKPVFSDIHTEGDCIIDVQGLHGQHLPRMVDFEEVLEELRSALQGTWEYSSPGHHSYALSNPVFTVNGDLILQLGSYDAIIKKELASPTPVTSSPRPARKTTSELSGGSLAVSTKSVRKSRSIVSRIMSVKTSSLFHPSTPAVPDHGLLSSSSADSPLLNTPLLDYTGVKQETSYFSKSLDAEEYSSEKADSSVAI